MDRKAVTDEERNAKAAELAGWNPPESNEPIPTGLIYHMPVGEPAYYEKEIAGETKRFEAHEVHRAYYWHTDDGRAASKLPDFCHDIAAAWELVGDRQRLWLSLSAPAGNATDARNIPPVKASVIEVDDDGRAVGSGEAEDMLAPRAITRAFILAMGGEKDPM